MLKNKEINWVNLFAEFFVVLIGILLAFQLNTCASESSERSTIEFHLLALKEETNFNKRNLKKAIELLETNEKNLDTLLTLVRKNGETQKINTLLLKLLNTGLAYTKSISYTTLIESGDIRFLDDVEFKTNTINLYEYYEWVKNTDQIALKSFDEQYFNYIKDNLDLLNNTVQPKEVYYDQVLLNSLASYKYFINMRKVRYAECMEVINEYLNSLEEKIQSF